MINDPVTVDLESTLDSIMQRIGEMSYPEDADMIRDESRGMLKLRWLPTEIVEHMRCREEVDKELEEDVALARMAVIENRVKARLGTERIYY